MEYNLSTQNWQFLLHNSYFSSKNNLLYISTPKVACTSLKWWIARLEGYSAAIRQLGGSQESSPELIIHDTFHKVAPEVTRFDQARLSGLFDAPDVLRFAVVRNPYKRIFSAWQSKLLLQEPFQSTPYLKHDFFHMRVSTPESIAYAFEAFLEHLASEEAPAFWDLHWTPQVDLLSPDAVPYTLIAQLENTSKLEELLQQSLGSNFINPFTSSNANESLIPFSSEYFTPRSTQLISELYRDDFERFGYETALPPSKAQQGSEAFRVALKGIDMLKSRHTRIADFQQRIKSTETKLQQQQELAGERAQLIEKLLETNTVLMQKAIDGAQEHRVEAASAEGDRAIAEALRQRDRLQEELNERNAQNGELTQSLAEHVQASESRYTALNSREQEIASLKSELSQCAEQISELQRNIDEQSQQGEHFGKQLSERNKELSRLRQYRAQAEITIAELTSSETSLKTQIHAQSAMLQEVRRKIGAYEKLSHDSALALESISQNKRQLRQDLVHNIELVENYSDLLCKYQVVTQTYARALALTFASRAWRRQSWFGKAKNSPRQQLSRLVSEEFGFDPQAYLENYPDIAQSSLTAEEHFLAFGLLEKRLYSLISDTPLPAPLQMSAKAAPKTAALLEGLLQSVRSLQGESGHQTSTPPEPLVECATFDPELYLTLYPDLKAAGVDPHAHYQHHGRSEGRIGCLPPLQIRGDATTFDPTRRTVMVVSHEASRTGAPILSLNLAQALGREYNVVAMLLGGGALEDAFVDANIVVVGPLNIRGTPNLASIMVAKVLDRFNIDLALVNSIESRVVLPALAERFIPSISLIHEFAAYTRPRHAFREALLWSGETVFSADLTLQSAQSEYPELSQRPPRVLPQGRCIVPAESIHPETMEKERKRIRNSLRPAQQPLDTLVVLGAGFVQLRKGVDLFIECAARVSQLPGGQKCQFVWIGQGYDPDQDTGYSVYLADQIRRAGLESVVRFIPETSAIDTVYEEADVLLLTSRLDPLPNVAIDAMDHGLPVLCFDKTTGIADFLNASCLGDECVAPYLDTTAMAERILSLANSTALREDLGERCRAKSRQYFEMTDYVSRLETLAGDVQIQCRQEKADLITIEHSELPRLDFILPPDLAETERSRALRLYTRSWASGIGCRKPFPGFHPGIYLQENKLLGSGIDPLADFIRAGHPEGPWQLPVLTPQMSVEAPPSTLRVALHIHAYYPDLLPEMLERLTFNDVLPDLYISVPSEEAQRLVSEVLKDFEGHFIKVEVVPNKGRDIGPMLCTFGRELVDGYDLVGHLHTKKTVDVADSTMGQNWFRFLMDNLLGTKQHPMADIILGRMNQDPSLGLIFPDDPYVTGWSVNRPFAEELAPRLGLSPKELPEHFHFPVGNMFWARSSVLAPLVSRFGNLSEYPDEPLPYDGSMLHALERLLPIHCISNGYGLAVTNVPNVTR
ncbi:glycosyltransferase [Pseudomonas nitroreducens]|uniref:Glycosyltransferase n=1 Tax=Pseudomonas nitroreducens TaxID=46680 RepID=A0A5R9A842_PSENT|nr:rhamnan synthesis F family protein [Pseudomonas nitroreducens]TLP74720.1 glycosyltransferase [Pseudomonas nitroreducens]